MRRIRQSVVSLQGLKTNTVEIEPYFNEEIKREMDRIVTYYDGVLNIFTVNNSVH